MQGDSIGTILNLADTLKTSIIDQPYATEMISEAMQVSRAGLNDPHKPLGVFLFTGPSGTGKTETAMTLAEQLYGGTHALTVINMSEFKEEHKVSLLLGSPPGYVGYGEGGVLTEAVRRKPYSLILLDEIEKAHCGVQEIFYQVFDKGILRDGQGRDVDFKNTVIIMTSNVGSETIMSLQDKLATALLPADYVEHLQTDLLKAFKPAFLGRLKVVPFLPLSSKTIKTIAKLKLSKIQARVQANYASTFTYDHQLLALITANCQQTMLGARTIDHLISQKLLPMLSNHYLTEMGKKKSMRDLKIQVKNGLIKLSVAKEVSVKKLKKSQKVIE